MGKKAQTHVEVILSFILFVGVLLFLFLVISPLATNTKKVSIIEDIQRIVIKNLSSEVGKLAVIVKSPGDCYSLSSVPEYGSKFVEINESNRRYAVYFSNDFSIGSVGCDPAKLNYTLGAYSKDELLIYENIKDLVSNYNTDYAGTKAALGITNNFAFSFKPFGQVVAGSSVVPPADYISYYPLESNANDFNGYNNGVVNGATFVGGKFGNAASFNGIDNYVDFGIKEYGSEFSGKLSVSFWFYSSNNTGIHYLIARGNTQSYGVWIEDDRLYSEFTGANTFDILENTWYHLAFTATNLEGKLYLNNISNLIGSGLGAGPGTKDTFLGAQPRASTGQQPVSGTYFQGYIDELKMYNRSLSAAEVSALYSGGSSTFSPGQIIQELSVSRNLPVGIEREAKEYPVRVLKTSGNDKGVKELILNIMSWE